MDTAVTALCHSCGRADCPAAGKPYVDDCPLWQEAEARAARGEYLTTIPGPVYEITGSDDDAA
jgi:hypothetical protein